jgi:putative ATP-dependent endonuclease of OLD family
MFLSQLRIENFRAFGEGQDALALTFNPGLTAIVGENDTGKTAVVDALRLALGTRDQEYFRVDENDFHQPNDGSARAKEIRICCRFEDLTLADKAAFAEHLTYEDQEGNRVVVLILNWKAIAPIQTGGQSRLRQHYVAMTRPTHLPCLAMREDALAEDEIAILKARKWRVGRVANGPIQWF